MYIVRHRSLFFWLTGLILVVALGAIAFYGLPLGIDFKGGSSLQIAYPSGRPEIATIQTQINAIPEAVNLTVRASGADAIVIRGNTLTPEAHDLIVAALSKGASTTELAFTSVGPSLGSQFAHKAFWAILAVALAIMLYIAFAFRHVSRPVPSWVYGLAVVVILIHDVIIPTGFYAVLAHFTGVEVDALFVTALLALLGYSVNDTIVIFDRVREHLAKNAKTNTKEDFADTVGKSISETMTRSINTSLTVVLALIVLVLLGAAATRDFALVMLVGVIAGTYSSILLAAPLLIPLSRYFIKK